MAIGTTVLVIENNESTQRLLQQTLRPRYTVLTASCWAQAHEIRTRAAIDALVVDVKLSSDSQTCLDALCAEGATTPVVLVASGSGEAGSTRMGDAPPSLFAFATGPAQLGELPRTLDGAIADRRVIRDSRPHPAGDESADILAESRAMRGVMGLIDRAALCDTPVLLLGESGTGKELLARALHMKGARATGAFVAVNCSAIPETLLESELFGHKRGAFTDARDDQRGLFQSAQRGTVFSR